MGPRAMWEKKEVRDGLVLGTMRFVVRCSNGARRIVFFVVRPILTHDKKLSLSCVPI